MYNSFIQQCLSQKKRWLGPFLQPTYLYSDLLAADTLSSSFCVLGDGCSSLESPPPPHIHRWPLSLSLSNSTSFTHIRSFSPPSFFLSSPQLCTKWRRPRDNPPLHLIRNARMQSSNLVFCNGESACFVVALSGYRRRWMEGEGEWWEEIVRQLACLPLHLGRGKQGWRMNECVHYREIKTTACLSLSISAFTLSSFLLLRRSTLTSGSASVSNSVFPLLISCSTSLPLCHPTPTHSSALSLLLWKLQYSFFSHVGMTRLKQISWGLLMCMTDSVSQLTDLYFHFWQKTWKEHTYDS